MALLNEIEAAGYLGFTSAEAWRRAKHKGEVPPPDMTRGQKPTHEFWLEETLLQFVKGGDSQGLSRDDWRKRIGGDQAA